MLLLSPFASFIVPTGLAEPLLPQDDAGQGGDAPDRFGDAWGLESTTIYGELRSAGLGFNAHQTSGSVKTVGDFEDWYKVRLKKAEKISVWLNVSDPDTSGIIRVHFVTPEQKIAQTVGFNAGTPVGIYAAMGGFWRLRVHTLDVGGPYELSYKVERPDHSRLAGGYSDKAYVVFGFDVGPGAKVLGSIRQFGGKTESRPITLFETVFREDGAVLGGAKAGFSSTMKGLHVEVLGNSATYFVRNEQDCTCVGGSVDPSRYAGRFYVSMILSTSWVYVNYDLELVGGAKFLGATTAPREELTVLRHEDFDGTLALVGGDGNAAIGLSAAISNEHFFLATFNCGAFVQQALGQCGASTPQGNPVPNPVQIAAPITGRWQFFRDKEASAGGEDELVVAADVELPDRDDRGRGRR